MSKDQTTGIAERVLYGILVGFAMRGVQRGWYDADMAAYLAAGGVTFLGGVYAWWINRPVALLNAAANQVPANAQLVIQPTPAATSEERSAARALANAASDKVTARTA